MTDLEHDQKHFIRILSLKVPEIRHLGTLYSVLSSSYHRNNERDKKFDFSFCFTFPRSITVQSFITIKWQEQKLLIIKIFKF